MQCPSERRGAVHYSKSHSIPQNRSNLWCDAWIDCSSLKTVCDLFTELVELGKLSRQWVLALKTPGLVHQLLCGKGVTTTRNSLELFAAAAVTTAVVL